MSNFKKSLCFCFCFALLANDLWALAPDAVDDDALSSMWVLAERAARIGQDRKWPELESSEAVPRELDAGESRQFQKAIAARLFRKKEKGKRDLLTTPLGGDGLPWPDDAKRPELWRNRGIDTAVSTYGLQLKPLFQTGEGADITQTLNLDRSLSDFEYEVVVHANDVVANICHEGSHRSQNNERVFAIAREENPEEAPSTYGVHGGESGYDPYQGYEGLDEENWFKYLHGRLGEPDIPGEWAHKNMAGALGMRRKAPRWGHFVLNRSKEGGTVSILNPDEGYMDDVEFKRVAKERTAARDYFDRQIYQNAIRESLRLKAQGKGRFIWYSYVRAVPILSGRLNEAAEAVFEQLLASEGEEEWLALGLKRPPAKKDQESRGEKKDREQKEAEEKKKLLSNLYLVALPIADNMASAGGPAEVEAYEATHGGAWTRDTINRIRFQEFALKMASITRIERKARKKKERDVRADLKKKKRVIERLVGTVRKVHKDVKDKKLATVTGRGGSEERNSKDFVNQVLGNLEIALAYMNIYANGGDISAGEIQSFILSLASFRENCYTLRELTTRRIEGVEKVQYEIDAEVLADTNALFEILDDLRSEVAGMRLRGEASLRRAGRGDGDDDLGRGRDRGPVVGPAREVLGPVVATQKMLGIGVDIKRKAKENRDRLEEKRLGYVGDDGMLSRSGERWNGRFLPGLGFQVTDLGEEGKMGVPVTERSLGADADTMVRIGKTDQFYPASRVNFGASLERAEQASYVIAEVPKRDWADSVREHIPGRSKDQAKQQVTSWFYQMAWEQKSSLIVLAAGYERERHMILDPGSDRKEANFTDRDGSNVVVTVERATFDGEGGTEYAIPYYTDINAATAHLHKVTFKKPGEAPHVVYQLVAIADKDEPVQVPGDFEFAHGSTKGDRNSAVAVSDLQFTMQFHALARGVIKVYNLPEPSIASPLLSVCNTGKDRSATLVVLDQFWNDIDTEIVKAIEAGHDHLELGEDVDVYELLMQRALFVEGESKYSVARDPFEKTFPGNWVDVRSAGLNDHQLGARIQRDMASKAVKDRIRADFQAIIDQRFAMILAEYDGAARFDDQEGYEDDGAGGVDYTDIGKERATVASRILQDLKDETLNVMDDQGREFFNKNLILYRHAVGTLNWTEMDRLVTLMLGKIDDVIVFMGGPNEKTFRDAIYRLYLNDFRPEPEPVLPVRGRGDIFALPVVEAPWLAEADHGPGQHDENKVLLDEIARLRGELVALDGKKGRNKGLLRKLEAFQVSLIGGDGAETAGANVVIVMGLNDLERRVQQKIWKEARELVGSIQMILMSIEDQSAEVQAFSGRIEALSEWVNPMPENPVVPVAAREIKGFPALPKSKRKPDRQAGSGVKQTRHAA